MLDLKCSWSCLPIILSDALHARANRVVLEYISIVLRKACCAPSVILQIRTSCRKLLTIYTAGQHYTYVQCHIDAKNVPHTMVNYIGAGVGMTLVNDMVFLLKIQHKNNSCPISNIHHFSCMHAPFIAYTHDDLCQKFETIFHNSVKGAE